jgi:hypothetical protein
VHRYLESSPACWAAYGLVLEREYSDPAWLAVHRLTVDAYAVQHPGRRSPQTIRSAAVHLIRLCLLLEHGRSSAEAVAAMQAAAARKHAYHWLEPPPDRGARTIADVQGAATPAEHAARVTAWARDAWQAWQPHHAQIRAWLPAAAGRRA